MINVIQWIMPKKKKKLEKTTMKGKICVLWLHARYIAKPHGICHTGDRCCCFCRRRTKSHNGQMDTCHLRDKHALHQLSSIWLHVRNRIWPERVLLNTMCGQHRPSSMKWDKLTKKERKRKMIESEREGWKIYAAILCFKGEW